MKSLSQMAQVMTMPTMLALGGCKDLSDVRCDNHGDAHTAFIADQTGEFRDAFAQPLDCVDLSATAPGEAEIFAGDMEADVTPIPFSSKAAVVANEIANKPSGEVAYIAVDTSIAACGNVEWASPEGVDVEGDRPCALFAAPITGDAIQSFALRDEIGDGAAQWMTTVSGDVVQNLVVTEEEETAE